MNLTTRCRSVFTVVCDTRVRTCDPYRVKIHRPSGSLFFSVGDSTWSHANPCRNEKCYSEMLRWFSADNLKLLPADETGQLSGAPLKDRMGGLPLFNEVQTAQCLLWDRSENAKCYCITLADHRPAISPNSTLPALATSACNSLGCGWGLHWPRASVNHLATGARTYHLPGTNPLEELNVLLRD